MDAASLATAELQSAARSQFNMFDSSGIAFAHRSLLLAMTQQVSTGIHGLATSEPHSCVPLQVLHDLALIGLLRILRKRWVMTSDF